MFILFHCFRTGLSFFQYLIWMAWTTSNSHYHTHMSLLQHVHVWKYRCTNHISVSSIVQLHWIDHFLWRFKIILKDETPQISRAFLEILNWNQIHKVPDTRCKLSVSLALVRLAMPSFDSIRIPPAFNRFQQGQILLPQSIEVIYLTYLD